MNIWKPIALASIAAFAVSLGIQTASASAPAPAAGGPCHDQPNMAAALTSLRAAKASLEKAEHNKGGWRVAAIQATDNAIRETDKGCAFADTH